MPLLQQLVDVFRVIALMPGCATQHLARAPQLAFLIHRLADVYQLGKQ
jgi:choline-glycine betaine transporter